MALNSRLYRCRVMHHRLHPRQHRFVYSAFMFYLDLDELATDQIRTRLLKPGKLAFYSFQEADYLPIGSDVPLKERVRAFLKRHGVELGHGQVKLLTNVRTLGYVFNPVSFYFCNDAEGKPLGVIAEVGNTFAEKKAFFIPPDGSETFVLRQEKHFYVSPYSDLDIDFDFRLQSPDERLNIAIDDWQHGQLTLKSTLTGSPLPLTDKNLLRLTLRYPLVTLKVIGLIHWEAFRLFLKKVPFLAKEAYPEFQRNILNPHVSLLAHPDSLDHYPYIQEIPS